MLDVALIWADTRVRLARPNGPGRQQALEGALRTLADAERLFGPKHVLYRRAALASLRRALRADPHHREARALRERLQRVGGRHRGGEGQGGGAG